METANKAFLMQGIKAVKMDSLASSLSISKRTLYEIYGDKESLLFACIKDDHEKRQAYLQGFAMEHTVMETVLEVYSRKLEDLRTVNSAFYADLPLYPKVMAFIEKSHRDMHEHFIAFMQRGVKEGYFRKEVNYELISLMFDSIGRYVAQEELYVQYPYEELLKNLMLVPLRGLCTPKGVKILSQKL